MKKKFRTGDIVKDITNKKIGIVGMIKGWWLIDNHIDVYFKEASGDSSHIGVSTLMSLDDLVIVKRREEVKNYWNYIAK